MKSPISRLIYPGASRSIGVEQIQWTLRPEEELIWRETACNERIGLITRPPSSEHGWIVFFYGNGMTLGGTAHIRQRLGSAGYGVVCVDYAGYGVSSGKPSEHGCYRSADAAVSYLQQEKSATLDQLALVGWSLGSAVAIDQASRRAVRAQVLLSPLTSLFAAALDLSASWSGRVLGWTIRCSLEGKECRLPDSDRQRIKRYAYPAVDGEQADERYGKKRAAGQPGRRWS